MRLFTVFIGIGIYIFYSSFNNINVDAKEMTDTKLELKKTKSGLEYQDLKVGEGDSPKQGQTVVVHYTGTLHDATKPQGAGKKFDSSHDRGSPFSFQIGVGQVIKGWDEGLSTMKVGGKRILVIPADLGYGARGAGAAIPPNATLNFEVELLKIQ